MDVYLIGEGHGAHDLRKICLDRGIRILGYVDPGRPVTLRSRQPTLPLEEVAGRPFDLIIVANPQLAGCRARLQELGVPAGRILVFYEDVPKALGRLGPITHFSMRRPGTTDAYTVLPLQGKHTQDTRKADYGPGEARLSAALCGMFRACTSALEDQDPLYRVGANWGNFLKSTRGALYEALAAEDLQGLHGLLANFWRNGLGQGIIGGEAAYRGFSAVPDALIHESIHPYLRALCHSLGGGFEARDLGLPLAGNPFGILLDGQLIQENSVMNHYRGVYLASLVKEIAHPVVAEVGGGVGFFARALLRQDPRITYIDFDLPETLLVEGYFLAQSFPNKKILFYDGSVERLTSEVLEAYDIILMPTFMVPRLEDGAVDLFVNTISFGEMSLPIVDNYLKEIERATRGFFYHENLCDLNFDYENYAADFFAIPAGFKHVFTAPSRWPVFGPNSPHHAFTENLYLKRGQIFGSP